MNGPGETGALAAAALEQALLASQLAHPSRVLTAIDPHDEMLLFARELRGEDTTAARADYFAQGLRVLAEVRQIVAWRFGGFAALETLLDFASGYGRVTRLLATEMAPERLWAADIYAEAMAFQRRAIGVHTLASGPRPEDFVCDRRFDFVLVSSLFSHLPEATFAGWLRRLVGCLSPRGLLAFTVHDAALLPAGRTLPASGILFTPASESRSLDPEQYGSSWVSEAFVRATLAAIDPAMRCLRLPRGHCNFQDLYLVAPGGSPPLVGLDFDPGPQGFLERCEVTPARTLSLAGWALEAGGGAPPRAVEIALPGSDVAVALTTFEHRPDLAGLVSDPAGLAAGFAVEIPLPVTDAPLALPFLVQAVSARGVRTVLGAGTLGSGQLAAARLHIQDLESLLAARDRSLAELGQRLAAEQAHVAGQAARIAAMEASRFWKLRNAWFAVKRALGLTRER